jgi:hypothetical protein
MRKVPKRIRLFEEFKNKECKKNTITKIDSAFEKNNFSNMSTRKKVPKRRIEDASFGSAELGGNEQTKKKRKIHTDRKSGQKRKVGEYSAAANILETEQDEEGMSSSADSAPMDIDLPISEPLPFDADTRSVSSMGSKASRSSRRSINVAPNPVDLAPLNRVVFSQQRRNRAVSTIQSGRASLVQTTPVTSAVQRTPHTGGLTSSRQSLQHIQRVERRLSFATNPEDENFLRSGEIPTSGRKTAFLFIFACLLSFLGLFNKIVPTSEVPQIAKFDTIIPQFDSSPVLNFHKFGNSIRSILDEIGPEILTLKNFSVIPFKENHSCGKSNGPEVASRYGSHFEELKFVLSGVADSWSLVSEAQSNFSPPSKTLETSLAAMKMRTNKLRTQLESGFTSLNDSFVTAYEAGLLKEIPAELLETLVTRNTNLSARLTFLLNGTRDFELSAFNDKSTVLDFKMVNFTGKQLETWENVALQVVEESHLLDKLQFVDTVNSSMQYLSEEFIRTSVVGAIHQTTAIARKPPVTSKLFKIAEISQPLRNFHQDFSEVKDTNYFRRKISSYGVDLAVNARGAKILRPHFDATALFSSYRNPVFDVLYGRFADYNILNAYEPIETGNCYAVWPGRVITLKLWKPMRINAIGLSLFSSEHQSESIQSVSLSFAVSSQSRFSEPLHFNITFPDNPQRFYIEEEDGSVDYQEKEKLLMEKRNSVIVNYFEVTANPV